MGNSDNTPEEQDGVPEHQEILRRVAESPRNYSVPRRVSRKHLESAFLTSFELIGGVPRLALWADQNPTQFYQLISKLFPQHVEAKIGADQSLAAILTNMGRAHVAPPPALEAGETVTIEQTSLPAPELQQ